MSRLGRGSGSQNTDIMKPCTDSQCKRKGELLPLSEFYRNRARVDQHNPHCKECHLRRVHEHRERERARKKAVAGPEVERKPMVLTSCAFSLVYEAVRKGCRTRQEIHLETGLDYDSIGEALAELVFDCKAVKIQHREYHLAA